MGWETRSGRRYGYDAERVGGRVVKRYVGAGRLADLAAQMHHPLGNRRKWTRIDREPAAARRSRPSRTGRLIDAADAVLAVWLPACGWHRPKRGTWRRRRGYTGGMPMTLATRKAVGGWDTDTL